MTLHRGSVVVEQGDFVTAASTALTGEILRTQVGLTCLLVGTLWNLGLHSKANGMSREQGAVYTASSAKTEFQIGTLT